MGDETSEIPDSEGFPRSRWIWREVSAVARDHYAVVSRDELLELGLSAKAIEHRCRAGFLHPLLRGVFALGHPVVSRRGQLRAATLWASGSAVCFGTGMELWRLRKWGKGPVDLTSSRCIHARRGIRAHRRKLPEDELTEVDGIPVTTVARTLLDIGASDGEGALRRGLREAHFLRLGRPQQDLLAVVERHPNCRGVAIARRVLTRGTWALRAHVGLEDEFLEFLAGHGLPLPRVNSRIRAGGRSFEVDCAWPERRLIIELDGRGSHSGDRGFESDRERDGALLAAGWRTYRLTTRRLREQPSAVAAELRALLGREAP